MIGVFIIAFEQRETERDIGLQGEAAFNPLLVAQRFLENSGIETESVVSMLQLKELPDSKDVLFLATQRYDIGPALREKIMKWVASGGHLIIVAWPESDSDSELQDPFLDELELSVNYDSNCDITSEKNDKIKSRDVSTDKSKDKSTGEISEKTSDTINDPESCEDIELKTVSVTILQEREKSEVAFDPSIGLSSSNKDKANWVINGEQGAHLVEYIKQKGLITVLTDYQFLTNTQFEKFDHAAFFWYLVHYSNNSGKVWIIYRGDMPPLYEWLAQNLWAPFLTLFFIVVIWIWSVLPRFGAMYPQLTSHRRNLIEHIRASGLFLWKNKFSEGLIYETRNALKEQISIRHPNWNKLTDTELVTRLVKQTGLSTEDVETALSAVHTTKEHEFYLIIQTLERLRKLI
jgi:hypothetical protein